MNLGYKVACCCSNELFYHSPCEASQRLDKRKITVGPSARTIPLDSGPTPKRCRRLRGEKNCAVEVENSQAGYLLDKNNIEKIAHVVICSRHFIAAGPRSSGSSVCLFPTAAASSLPTFRHFSTSSADVPAGGSRWSDELAITNRSRTSHNPAIHKQIFPTLSLTNENERVAQKRVIVVSSRQLGKHSLKK